MAVSPVMPVIENWTARSGFRTTVPSMARPVSVGIPATPMSPGMEMAKRYEGRVWGGGGGGRRAPAEGGEDEREHEAESGHGTHDGGAGESHFASSWAVDPAPSSTP